MSSQYRFGNVARTCIGCPWFLRIHMGFGGFLQKKKKKKNQWLSHGYSDNNFAGIFEERNNRIFGEKLYSTYSCFLHIIHDIFQWTRMLLEGERLHLSNDTFKNNSDSERGEELENMDVDRAWLWQRACTMLSYVMTFLFLFRNGTFLFLLVLENYAWWSSRNYWNCNIFCTCFVMSINGMRRIRSHRFWTKK